MSSDERITLSDGYRIGFARYGDDEGVPAFYFHGLPGSRREGAVFDRACRNAGVQLIAPDRPGYGWSDPVQGSPLVCWPRWIGQLADHLGFARFHVVGMSGGAPYALACASVLRERVGVTAVCGGLGEVCDIALRARMAPQARLGFWLCERGSGFLAYTYGPVVTLASRIAPRLSLRCMARLNAEPDRSVLREPAVRAWLAANLREAFRQGSVGGVADMCAAVQPWPFDPSCIRALRIWHGRRDRIVPMEHSERLARRVPSAMFVAVEGEGHFSLPVRHASAIVASLLGAVPSSR